MKIRKHFFPIAQYLLKANIVLRYEGKGTNIFIIHFYNIANTQLRGIRSYKIPISVIRKRKKWGCVVNPFE